MNFESYWQELLEIPLPENLRCINDEATKFINYENNIFEFFRRLYIIMLDHIRENCTGDIVEWSLDLRDDIIIVVNKIIETSIGEDINHFFVNENQNTLDICLFHASCWFNQLEDDDKIIIRDEMINANHSTRKSGLELIFETISTYIHFD